MGTPLLKELITLMGKMDKDGQSNYIWVKYSAYVDGTNFSDTPNKYIGIATTTTPTTPTLKTAYKWTKIEGTDGSNGIQGETGANGQTSYLHIKYSDNGTSFTANNGETVGIYRELMLDFVEADSMTFSKYTWNKVKGEDGTDGKSITLVDVEYAVNTSTTTPPIKTSNLWKTAPNLGNQQLWSRTKTTYSTGNPTYSTPVNITPKTGAGVDGNSITSITEWYYLSTSKTAPTGGSWSTTPWTWINGMFIWTKTVFTYSKTADTETLPIVSSEWEAVNELEIGGRNLVRNSGFTSEDGWRASDGANWGVSASRGILWLVGGTAGESIMSSADNLISLKAGSFYTISYELQFVDMTMTSPNIRLGFSRGGLPNASAPGANISLNVNSQVDFGEWGEWQTIKATVQATHDVDTCAYLHFGGFL